ncbi:membrane metallo-endopeptidase-like 1 [Pseudomyrmex gracilis]|uniref:membrane metallo-endopeptidase-like 1 n=1 Tax=Pseudomyrmex gracilis TaxID=219809 RepID=UPI000995B038|nr:membrane metallo-endopeptidase-like 1 [Pseudomyrmex gracilis]
MRTYRFFIVFLTAYGTFYAPAYSIQYRQFILCTTNECRNAASEILEKLDPIVDPCDDFYKFACGEWLQYNQANKSFPLINFYTVLSRNIHNQLREMLEVPTNPSDTMSFQKAKHVFAQCMNHDIDKNTSSKAVKMTNFSITGEANGIARNKQRYRNVPKWEKCVNTVKMHTAISHEYVKKYASHLENEETLENIKEIVRDIYNVVREQIHNCGWTDEYNKELFLEKLEHIKFEFIKPEWYSDEAIDRFYEDLNVNKPYVQNQLKVSIFEEKKLESLRNSDNQFFLPWIIHPTTPDIFYDSRYNKIAVPAALLQKPVYDRNRPAVMNYATLGAAIGREITHAFDKNCMQDQDNTYSGKTTQSNYRNITQCFIDQYNNYQVQVQNRIIRVNGSLTCTKNLGDSAGIFTAYQAYKYRKTRRGEEDFWLEGLHKYTDEQVFFLTYAQLFCETALPQKIQKNIVQTVSSLRKIRIRGSLSNSREFSDAYDCLLGTRMNPTKKCTFW